MVWYWCLRNSGVRIYEDIPIHWLASTLHWVWCENVPWQMSGKWTICVWFIHRIIELSNHSPILPYCVIIQCIQNPYTDQPQNQRQLLKNITTCNMDCLPSSETMTQWKQCAVFVVVVVVFVVQAGAWFFSLGQPNNTIAFKTWCLLFQIHRCIQIVICFSRGLFTLTYRVNRVIGVTLNRWPSVMYPT